MLVNTKEAAKATGLSEYELRRGFKAGKYPALVIGRNGERARLRWNLEMLKEAIVRLMTEDRD